MMVPGPAWKRHRGGPCRIAGDVRVEVRYRAGEIDHGPADAFDWCWQTIKDPGDITAWRVAPTVDPRVGAWRHTFWLAA